MNKGRAAGTNIAGGDASFGGVLGTAITKFQNLKIGRTGLTTTRAGRRCTSRSWPSAAPAACSAHR